MDNLPVKYLSALLVWLSAMVLLGMTGYCVCKLAVRIFLGVW